MSSLRRRGPPLCLTLSPCAILFISNVVLKRKRYPILRTISERINNRQERARACSRTPLLGVLSRGRHRKSAAPAAFHASSSALAMGVIIRADRIISSRQMKTSWPAGQPQSPRPCALPWPAKRRSAAGSAAARPHCSACTGRAPFRPWWPCSSPPTLW